MEGQKFSLDGKEVVGYVIPVGPVNLVIAQTSRGLVGCKSIDVIDLETFAVPAANVRSATAGSINSIDDLLKGRVDLVNTYAKEAGITQDMTGEDALRHLL